MRTETDVHLRRVTSNYLTTLFNLNDPTECFMLGWISRIHTDPPRLYQTIAMKRYERQTNGKAERLIFELARYRGKKGGFTVIRWNIDEISVSWKDCPNRREALKRYEKMF